MHKAMFAAVVAAGLIAAPLPPVVTTAAAQTAAPAKPDAKTDTKPAAKTKQPPSAGVAAMRERQKKCGAEWKAAKAAGKVEKGNEVAAILERLQQAPQERHLSGRKFQASRERDIAVPRDDRAHLAGGALRPACVRQIHRGRRRDLKSCRRPL